MCTRPAHTEMVNTYASASAAKGEHVVVILCGAFIGSSLDDCK